MPRIELTTAIRAPAARCFDLCRSVDVHLAGTVGTGEVAIAGVTSGLMGPGDEVTWSARHLGLRWTLTSRITAYDRPAWFRDSMVRGVFRRFDHDHHFEERDGMTRVRDVFDYTSPLGPLGRLADRLAVAGHMRRFLEVRMRSVAAIAESNRWREFLAGSGPSREET